MRYPQIILYEADAAIEQSLAPTVETRRWLLRQPRQAPACLNLMREGGPLVLVLKIGRHIVRELTFLDQVHQEMPDAPVLVVADAEDYLLLRLAMELGATFVLMPPQSRQDLAEIVARLMETSIQRTMPSDPIPNASFANSSDQTAEEPPLEPNS